MFPNPTRVKTTQFPSQRALPRFSFAKQLAKEDLLLHNQHQLHINPKQVEIGYMNSHCTLWSNSFQSNIIYIKKKIRIRFSPSRQTNLNIDAFTLMAICNTTLSRTQNWLRRPPPRYLKPFWFRQVDN